MPYRITLPFDRAEFVKYKSGAEFYLNGVIYTARDAAHQRIQELIARKETLPFPLANQIIYYAGPAPTPADKPIGSIGPTTSDRMDVFTPELLDLGLAAVIGKGPRAAEVKASLQKNKALYLGALGGAGALLARAVTAAQVIAFPELGTEAVRRLTVRDFPVTLIYDIHGGDLYADRYMLG
ncbi:fumarate hydratase subunit beta [Candidatus Termititenax persephonae]|uniref:Fumarate hydratase subunit beta n=1 Tax=Candidatus Termititenax persephonae TaxID=2218525 RepID=A0A388TFV4_9BACT|nr:fumarate hydratase subunit beta [Candidatus Termititenax persephonae]